MCLLEFHSFGSSQHAVASLNWSRLGRVCKVQSRIDFDYYFVSDLNILCPVFCADSHKTTILSLFVLCYHEIRPQASQGEDESALCCRPGGKRVFLSYNILEMPSRGVVEAI